MSNLKRSEIISKTHPHTLVELHEISGISRNYDIIPRNFKVVPKNFYVIPIIKSVQNFFVQNLASDIHSSGASNKRWSKRHILH